MKKKILIADKLIQPFEKVYKHKFKVDCLWKIKTKSNSLEYEAVIVTGGFKTNKHFLKKFKKLKNVILSPHHASGTKETRYEMAKLSCINVFNFFNNKKPIHKIT